MKYTLLPYYEKKEVSMSRSLKSLMAISCLALFFASSDFNKLEAADGRWSAYNNEQRGGYNNEQRGAYNNERGAWGGNGGWWGNGNSDWYGDYGWPESNHYSGGYNSHPAEYNGYNYNGSYYNNSYPYDGQQYYGNDGIGAGANIDGAGLYFNVR